jgi:cysteinyl-tRNA synthetase
VRYWMHNGFVRVDEEKMSKSLGNFFTVREVLASYDAEVVRFFIVRAHYRSPLNYSDAHLEDAKAALTRLYTALKHSSPENRGIDWDEPYARRFKEAMDDDFGTPEAVAVLFDLAREVGRGRGECAAQLKALGGLLGILQRDPVAFLQGKADDTAWIEARIDARNKARATRDFAEGDRIRKELAEKGIVLEDMGGRTSWRRL